MKSFQVRNMMGCWKATEEEVMEVVNRNGGMKKATFEKVDGYFKDQDRKRRQSEWKKFKGISVKFSNNSFFVMKGLFQNLKRFFDSDDFYHPEGWDRSIQINGHMVTFTPCRIFGSKTCKPNDWQMYVKIHGTRAEMIEGQPSNHQVFVIPYRMITKPVKEEGQSKPYFMGYLEENSCTSFSEAEIKQWKKEKKLRFYTGKL